ncbi:MAG: hypothetical protein AAF555_05650 [Verrucomicrobiota bacterium]
MTLPKISAENIVTIDRAARWLSPVLIAVIGFFLVGYYNRAETRHEKLLSRMESVVSSVHTVELRLERIDVLARDVGRSEAMGVENRQRIIEVEKRVERIDLEGSLRWRGKEEPE